MFTGLALVALTAGTALPVVIYGDAAYPAIYDSLDGHGRDWLDYHSELADTWAPLLYANAVLALVALVLGIPRPSSLRWSSLLVALVTLAAITAASVVANAGGKIQHPEFRLTDPPKVAALYQPGLVSAYQEPLGGMCVSDRKKVLFVCVENSNRSQMAEAFARLLGGEAVEAYSAGSAPSGKVNPKAVAAMQTFGYDLASHRSTSLDDLPPVEFDAVITMGCGDSCPHVSARSPG